LNTFLSFLTEFAVSFRVDENAIALGRARGFEERASTNTNKSKEIGVNNWKRTEACGTMRSADVGKEVVLNGWVHRQRDFGDLVFIDLRDRTGIVQIVVDKNSKFQYEKGQWADPRSFLKLS